MDTSNSNPGVLSLTFLGVDRIALNHEPVKGIASNKVRGLLAYLAVESDRPHHRGNLAELFWPEREVGVGRKNLKQAIANLREVLGDRESSTPYLIVSRDKIQFNQSNSHQLDVREFIEELETATEHTHLQLGVCDTCQKSLERAVELYQGDFLADFFLPDGQPFEEWAVVRRENLQ